jgi:hypothetical protein
MGGTMYATIRRYTMKDLGNAEQTLAAFKQRLEGKFVPVLQDVRGFHSYYVVTSNDRELVSVSIFEDRTGAEESTRRAAEFVRTDPIKDQLSTPEITEGELLVSKEALVGAH